MPPVIIGSRWFRTRSNRAYLEVRERDRPEPRPRCRRGWRACGSCRRSGGSGVPSRFEETNEAQYDANLETVRISARYFPFVEFIGVLGIATIVGVGGLFVDQGIVTVGTVLAFVLYLNSLFEPIQQLSQLYNTVQSRGRGAEQGVRAARHRRRRSPRSPGAVDLPAERCDRSSTTCRSRYGTPDPMVLRDVSLDGRAG